MEINVMRNTLAVRVVLAAVFLLFACKTSSSSRVRGFQAQLPSDRDPRQEFVRVESTNFMLAGKPFVFQGTNFYRVGLRDVLYTDQEVADIMTKIHGSGMRVLRLWGFSCGTTNSMLEAGMPDSGNATPPILNRQGEYEEQALIYLDRVIASAGSAGLKVILPFVNFEPAYCGMEWWAHAYGVKTESKQSFYCNPDVIKAYKAYIATMLNRVNTVNGISYKNDPAIMAIEVANEPHTEDGYETSGHVDPSCKAIANGKPGEIVNHWLQEITSYVRSIDSNHLISTGEEGYRTKGDQTKNAWVHNGLKGVDFDRNIQLPNVSFATVHLYPDNWNLPQEDFDSWYVPQVIKNRAEVAHTAGKPIVMEETGFSIYVPSDTSKFMEKVKAHGYYKDRAKWIGAMYKAANDAGYSGTMIWQAVPVRADGTPYDSDYFTFGFNDPAMAAITNQVEAIRKRYGFVPGSR
jgi:mannan endo-1,4-beta-mannosidase